MRATASAFVSVLVLAAAAGGATVPADLVPSRLTLQAADLPAAKIDSQGPVHEPGYVVAYQRTFVYNAPSGGSGLVYVQSEALVASKASAASAELDRLQASLGTAAGRASVAKAVARSLKVKTAAVRVSPPRARRVGDHTVELPLSVRLETRRIYESLLYMQLDRVLSVVVSAAVRPPALGETRRLASAVVLHIDDALKPRILGVPTVFGDAQQGVVLTATTGGWSGDAEFSSQWQRCQGSDMSCTDIPGATNPTYTIADADVGFMLRVAVTASNRFGKTVATSALTAPVVAPPPPPPPPELP